jgi:hypothetical protein
VFGRPSVEKNIWALDQIAGFVALNAHSHGQISTWHAPAQTTSRF